MNDIGESIYKVKSKCPHFANQGDKNKKILLGNFNTTSITEEIFCKNGCLNPFFSTLDSFYKDRLKFLLIKMISMRYDLIPAFEIAPN